MTLEALLHLQAQPFNLFDLIIEWEIHQESYLDSLKLKPISKYKAIEIMGKDFVLSICNEKIIAMEDYNTMLELRNILLLDEEKYIPQIKVENAKEVEMVKVLDELGIKHRLRHCICPFCNGTNCQKFSFNRNLYKCFSCWVKWNTITFIKEYMKLEFKEAVLFLNKL